jgi:hypothetical protein
LKAIVFTVCEHEYLFINNYYLCEIVVTYIATVEINTQNKASKTIFKITCDYISIQLYIYYIHHQKNNNKKAYSPSLLSCRDQNVQVVDLNDILLISVAFV